MKPASAAGSGGVTSVRLRRAAFWAFALALFVATHFPRLEIEVAGVERPDLFIHFAVFAVWYLLLVASTLLGPPHSTGTLLVAWVVAAVYACIDEGLQAIPALGRHAAWDDLIANLGGITIGAAVAWVFAVVRRPREREESPL